MDFDKALGVANTDIVPVEDDEVVDLQLTEDDEVEADFQQSQQRLDRLLEKGEELFHFAFNRAKVENSVDAIDSCTRLLKEMGKVNKEVMENRKALKAIREKKPEKTTQNNKVTNNIVFEGTTADFLKMIKGDVIENGGDNE